MEIKIRRIQSILGSPNSAERTSPQKVDDVVVCVRCIFILAFIAVG